MPRIVSTASIPRGLTQQLDGNRLRVPHISARGGYRRPDMGNPGSRQPQSLGPGGADVFPLSTHTDPTFQY